MNPKTISKAKKMIKGLTLEWNDANPTEEDAIEKPKISHKNPILRLAATQMLADYSNYIFKRLRFKWRVTITLFFKYPNRDKYEEEIILDADCYLADINDFCLSEIKTELRRHHKKAFYNSRFFLCLLSVFFVTAWIAYYLYYIKFTLAVVPSLFFHNKTKLAPDW